MTTTPEMRKAAAGRQAAFLKTSNDKNNITPVQHTAQRPPQANFTNADVHERALSALHAIDPGCDRDSWIKIGMSARDAGIQQEEFIAWSSNAPNYAGERDCITPWNSFTKGGVTEATLYRLALDAGWNDPFKAHHDGHNKLQSHARPSNAIRPEKTPQTPNRKVAKADVAEVWGRCVPADPADAYVQRKRGIPDGVRVYPATEPPLLVMNQNVAGYLVVPCWSGDQLQTLQFIPQHGGDKLNLPGASFNDGYFQVGKITNRIYIVEGLGQAWAVHQASESAAVVCFGAGRMARVAAVLREKYALARLVIVPDRGKEDDAAKIADNIAGEWCELPAEKPNNYDFNDLAVEHGSDAVADTLEKTKTPRMRYRLLTDADLAAMPPLRWRIKNVLPETGLAAIFGPSGSGKSFLVLDALQSLAAGKRWFGYRVQACPVVYCSLEGEGGIAGRVEAYRRRHGGASRNIRYLVQPFSLLENGDIFDLSKAIMAAGSGSGVVVLDTLNRAAPGADENDSKSMGQIIGSAKQLQTLLGGLVLLIHHTGKDPSKGLRGHSSLLAALDAAIEVRRDHDNREWLVGKSKDGEDGASHPFMLDRETLGVDTDGDVISSCVVVPVEEAADAIRRILPPKSGNQKTIWEALVGILRKSATSRPEGAPDALPQGKACVRIEDAIEKTRGLLIVDPKRQTERTQAAIRGLVERGLLFHEGGFLWCK